MMRLLLLLLVLRVLLLLEVQVCRGRCQVQPAQVLVGHVVPGRGGGPSSATPAAAAAAAAVTHAHGDFCWENFLSLLVSELMRELGRCLGGDADGRPPPYHL